jgi:hypothetical protein
MAEGGGAGLWKEKEGARWKERRRTGLHDPGEGI